MRNQDRTGGALSFFGLAFIVLIVLKIFGFIAWPWLVVFMPVIGGLIVVAFFPRYM
jgi:hypothetical protein